MISWTDIVNQRASESLDSISFAGVSYESRRKERLKESASNCKDAVARPKLDPLQTLTPPATRANGPSVMTLTILNSQWVVASKRRPLAELHSYYLAT
jgi:hypothetical protein